MKQSVTSFLFAHSIKKHFQKEKGKKESPIAGVKSSNRRAISPAGWFGGGMEISRGYSKPLCARMCC
jgi:hypothetical protein